MLVSQLMFPFDVSILYLLICGIMLVSFTIRFQTFVYGVCFFYTCISEISHLLLCSCEFKYNVSGLLVHNFGLSICAFPMIIWILWLLACDLPIVTSISRFIVMAQLLSRILRLMTSVLSRILSVSDITISDIKVSFGFDISTFLCLRNDPRIAVYVFQIPCCGLPLMDCVKRVPYWGARFLEIT